MKVIKVFGGLVLILVAGVVLAQGVPQLINYQGRLTDDTGLPIDGTREMRFRLLDADTLSASVLWSETQSSVQVDQGIYHVLLGSVVPIAPSALSQADIFLEVRVEGEILRPRSQVTSVAFAHKAAAVPDGVITSAMISDGTITGSDIDSLTITSSNIADGTITSTQVQDNSLTASDIQDIYVLNSGDTVTGDLQVDGNIGIGRAPGANYGIVNNQIGAPQYGAYLYGNQFGFLAALSSDPSDHYAYISSQDYGIYARSGESDETGGRYGARFESSSQGYSCGVYGEAYGYGTLTNTHGVRGYARNESSGDVYAGWFSVSPLGTGMHYGVWASADDYAGWFQDGRVHVGDGGTEDYVDGDGDHYVEDELEVDGAAYFSGGLNAPDAIDSSDIADGAITGADIGTDELDATQIQDIYVLNTGDTVTGDLQVNGNEYIGLDLTVSGGNIGIGTAPNSSYGIVNDLGFAPDYGAQLYGATRGIHAAWSDDPSDHYAYLGSQDYGVYARVGSSGETGNKYGGRFSAWSDDTATGAFGEAYGYGTQGAYGVHGYASNNSSGKAYGGYFETNNQGTGTHYGVYASSSCATTGDAYGVYGNGINSSNGSAIGGYFITNSAGTGTNYGVIAIGNSDSPSTAYGAYSYTSNTSTGPAYAGYFATTSSGTGEHYGVYGYSNGNSSSASYGVRGYGRNESSGDAYAGYFSTSTTGTGTHYGVWASADDYAGWFQDAKVHVGNAGTENYVDGDGDLYVEDVLEVDGDLYVGDELEVGGNADFYGNLRWNAKTSYVSVAAAAFLPRSDNSMDYLISENFLINNSGAAPNYLYAPVHLPHNANVTRLTFCWSDTSSSYNGTLDLCLGTLGGPYYIMASASSNGSSGVGSSYDDSIDYQTIDNDFATYYLRVELPDSNVQYCGSVIEYTIDQPY